ncbi:putative pre-mRNA-splicing factor CWC26 [Paratrimastix pyriformis]|uniref:Pre-mRNA-splicing factor CWC26 n=1 Tax=Paratrimastix pyriformis TaxID=342808 RepID=A0ABQ8UUZ6_9EUKA|nr:putative pre-mRNA-splicing factor CWC26 [Paratrimastix pyriformis]
MSVSQAEYLKRYLGGSEKKHTKKKKSASAKVRIVDEDAHLKTVLSSSERNAEDTVMAVAADDAPTLVEARELPSDLLPVAAPQQKASTRSGWVTIESADTDDAPVISIPKELRGDERLAAGAVKIRIDAGGDATVADEAATATAAAAAAASPDRRQPAPRRPRQSDGEDLSPPRASAKVARRASPSSGARAADLSPARGRGERHTERDLSPPRGPGASRGPRGDEDLSPPRGPQPQAPLAGDVDLSPPRPADGREPPPIPAAAETMSSGRKAGVATTAEYAAESERRAAVDEEMALQMGKGARTMLRDKTGRLMTDIESFVADQRLKEATAQERQRDMARGTAQKQAEAARAAELVAMEEAPFAREEDDEALNRERREALRWGDPMAAYVARERRKKAEKERKKKGLPAAPEGPQKKAYQGPYQPNRFNIPPGHLWDGRDRSNGFEQRLYQTQAAQSIRKDEAFNWSISEY